jgi:hypothetical protein
MKLEAKADLFLLLKQLFLFRSNKPLVKSLICTFPRGKSRQQSQAQLSRVCRLESCRECERHFAAKETLGLLSWTLRAELLIHLIMKYASRQLHHRSHFILSRGSPPSFASARTLKTKNLRGARNEKQKENYGLRAAELVIRFGQFFLLAQLRDGLGHANILVGFVCWFWRGGGAVSARVTRRSTAPLTAPEWL